MRKKCNAVLVVCSIIFLIAGSSQPAGAAMPNLGQAPGQGGDSANGLVTEVVLPQLGLGNTGQDLSGPILEYLSVEMPGGDGLVLDLLAVGGQAPAGNLAGDVVLPTLAGLEPGDRPGEILPGLIHDYLGVTVGGDGLVFDPTFEGDALFVSAPLSLGGSVMAIPEPATMSLLALGAAALLRRRK